MMTVAQTTRAVAAKWLTLVPLIALVLSSCTPVSNWQPADGGPTPPINAADPLANPSELLADAAPTSPPDTEVIAEPESDDAEEIEVPSPPVATLTPTPTAQPVVAAEPITMQDALNCLASGRVVYGLALQNTNVRQETNVAACRIGRIPKGSLVRITGSLDEQNSAVNIALVTPAATPTAVLAETLADATSEMTGGEDAEVAVAESTAEPSATAPADTPVLATAQSSMATATPGEASSGERALNAIFGGRNTDASESSTESTDSNTVALLPTATPTPTPSPTSAPAFTSTPVATATATATRTATPAPTDPSAAVEPIVPSYGYVEDIQPLFNRTCNSCHSSIVKSNDLQVTDYDALMAGGKSGLAVIPGDADSSLLWHQIETGVMPMVGELNDVDKAMVRDWIDAGAPEYRPATPTATATPTLAATATADASVTVAAADVETSGDDVQVDSDTTPTPVPTPTLGVIVQLPQQDASAGWSFENPVAASSTSSGPQPFADADAMWGAWLVVDPNDYDVVADACADPAEAPLSVVSSELILPVACGVAPSTASLDLLRVALALPVSTPEVATSSTIAESAASTDAVDVAATGDVRAETAEESEVAAETTTATTTAESATSAPVAATAGEFSAATAGISAKAIGLAAPADGDGWLTPRGGYCIAQQIPENDRSVTALAFAPDGRLFLALDSKLTGEVDPLVLNDAYHPSRSIAVYDPVSGNTPVTILDESARVTGMDYDNGILWVTRAGEVGIIPDGGSYETLAAGFAVDSHLYHANNGIVVSGGYVYVSAGGVRDGYYEGPIIGISEQGAQDYVSGGNAWAARIVRASTDELLTTRNISAFKTAARGVRNPYGITVDPSGRIWWTDNGATNVPDGVRAGDEVDVLEPANAGGGEANSPYYGFPLAIMDPQPSFVDPVVNLVNTAAPTGITWAMGTIFFAQYGRDPGLYRLGESGGTVIAERVLLGWPILAVTTAPDGALWIGLGDGTIYRITQGCNN